MRNGLAALEDKNRIDVFFSPELRGGADYREKIKESASGADLFVLIYPGESRNFGWCWFELGCFFHGSATKHTVCIRNAHIRALPPQVEAWQAYNADDAGIRGFFTDLFVNGTFSRKRPLNPGVDADEHFRTRRDEWVKSICESFARSRVRETFFPRRLTIVDRSAQGGGINFRKATVTGAASAFGMQDGPIDWDYLKRQVNEKFKTVDWMTQIERTHQDLARGAIGGNLAPFASGDDSLLLPVISRVESFDDVLKLVNVIMVDVPCQDLERFFEDWDAPRAMPDQWVALIRLCNFAIKFRWGHLIPLENQLTNRVREPRDILEAFTAALRLFEQKSAKFFTDRGQVETIYSGKHRRQIESAISQYPGIVDEANALMALPQGDENTVTLEKVRSILDRMKAINSVFLKAGSVQFAAIVAELPGQQAVPPKR